MRTENKKNVNRLKIKIIRYSFLILAGVFWVSEVCAQGNPYVVDTIISVDGSLIEVTVSPSPPQPPRSIDRTAVALSQLKAKAGVVTIDGVPAFDWCFGCSPTSAAMIAGYYDRHGFSDMYTGPTNSGIMPLDNSSWGTWVDPGSETRSQCPLSATRNGLDGRAITGHLDDYWIQYGNSDPDPFIGNWTEHTYEDCTGDYMKTNQSTYSNSDGSTTFYYFPSGAPMTAAGLVSNSVEDQDGGYGIELFYESKGYTVTDMYNQYIKGYGSNPDLGFTYAQYCAEIDANRPVMIHVEGHTMVGIGYDDESDTMYIHDTWDSDMHKMAWGSTYSGMAHMGVTIVQLQGTIQYTVNFVEGSNGSVTGTLVQTIGHGSNCTEVTAAPDANYHFTGWTGSYTGMTNPLTITNVTSDMTITANFAIDQHTVTFVEGSDGSITGTLVQAIDHGGNCTEVTAAPDANYHFTGWTGDYTGITNPLTISNVTSAMTITANFSIDQHTVTFVEGTDGGITGTLVQAIDHGSNCTEVTAEPDANYHFTGWTGSYTGMTNPLTISNVTSAMTITANFSIDQHTVTFVEGSDGSITGTLVQAIDHGSNCTEVTAAPDANYHFTGWTGSYTGMTNPLTITNVTSVMTITANFAIDQYTVTFNAGSNGDVNGQSQVVQTVDHGSDATAVTANPSTGYHFDNWTGYLSSSDNPLTITNVTSDITVTANFSINIYTVSVFSGSNGSVNPSDDQSVDYGNTLLITASPSTGYHFSSWDVSGGVAITDEDETGEFTITGDGTIQASFAINDYTVTISSNGNGNVTPSGDQPAAHNEVISVTANADAEYHFDNWTVTGGVSITDGDETGEFTITGNGTIAASFTINQYMVTFIPGANGNITGALTQTVNHGDNCTEVSAVPDANYHFTGWSGSYTGIDNPLTITNVTSDMTINANFAIDQYTVTFNAGVNGDVNGQSQVVQAVDHGSNCTAVTANPSTGYHFDGWTGDHNGADNPITVTNVTSDMAITANFAINTYSVHVSSSGNGIVTPSGEQSVEHNDILSITASPNTDYQLSEWNVTGGVSIIDGDESGLFRITGAGTITAVFRLATSVINNGNTPKIANESFSVCPNPVSNNAKLDLFFQGKFKSDAELIIYDQVGNLVFNESYPQIGGDLNKPKKFGQWNLRNKNGRVVSSGTYLAVLTVSGDYGQKERFIAKVGVKEY